MIDQVVDRRRLAAYVEALRGFISSGVRGKVVGGLAGRCDSTYARGLDLCGAPSGVPYPNSISSPSATRGEPSGAS